MHKDRRERKEMKNGGFSCSHCGGWVETSGSIGTQHRNHCPSCLWSKHLDQGMPGDRESSCGSGMEPVGLVFKKEKLNKYGPQRRGEIMVVHHCMGPDGKISANRIAGDDNPNAILDILDRSQKLDQELKRELGKKNLELIHKEDEEEVKIQLFGKRQ